MLPGCEAGLVHGVSYQGTKVFCLIGIATGAPGMRKVALLGRIPQTEN